MAAYGGTSPRRPDVVLSQHARMMAGMRFIERPGLLFHWLLDGYMANGRKSLSRCWAFTGIFTVWRVDHRSRPTLCARNRAKAERRHGNAPALLVNLPRARFRGPSKRFRDHQPCNPRALPLFITLLVLDRISMKIFKIGPRRFSQKRKAAATLNTLPKPSCWDRILMILRMVQHASTNEAADTRKVDLFLLRYMYGCRPLVAADPRSVPSETFQVSPPFAPGTGTLRTAGCPRT